MGFKVGDRVVITKGPRKGSVRTVCNVNASSLWYGGGWCSFKDAPGFCAWGALKKARTFQLENK